MSTPRLIPDSECVQGKCGRTTTGCWDRCSMKPSEYSFAANSTSHTTISNSSQSNEFVLNLGNKHEVRFTKQGMLYQGALVKDAGQIYRSVMNAVHGKPQDPNDAPLGLPILAAKIRATGYVTAEQAYEIAELIQKEITK